jgi:orotidine-5'-phosphate decarboxylase
MHTHPESTETSTEPSAGPSTTLSIEQARQHLLVALDVPTLSDGLPLVEALRDKVGGFKVGLELCTGEGVPHVVRVVSEVGGSVFLDLKLKDIPNTVAGALRAIAATAGGGVRMITLHTDGGRAMLEAAVEAAHRAFPEAGHPPPLLLGVTVLTSIDDAALAEEINIPHPAHEQVIHLARLAKAAGLNGVVASPHEVAAIKQACGPTFLTVTPGIRPTWAGEGDQRRIMTPADARRAGADYLVVGRPITQPPAAIGTPADAAQRILEELVDS